MDAKKTLKNFVKSILVEEGLKKSISEIAEKHFFMQDLGITESMNEKEFANLRDDLIENTEKRAQYEIYLQHNGLFRYQLN